VLQSLPSPTLNNAPLTPLRFVSPSPHPTSIPSSAPEFLQVVSPNGGETLEAGSDALITWHAASNIAWKGFTLEYTTCDTCVKQIAIVSGDARNFSWVVDKDIVTDRDKEYAKIIVIGYTAPTGQMVDKSDDFFTVRRSE
jgi:hypothetical protein